ncbi:MAG TPA: hypothetical protein VFT15_12075, partial [Chitinophagaceae bacterium]|nr:hypothetical protein [Chitinophagaceae bacterium]
MDIISGSHKILQFGLCSAWANFILFIVYDLIVITGIVIGQGVLKEPYLAIAEVMTLVSAPLLVLLMVAIHECAPQSAKVFSLTALGWMLLLAGSTVIVHFINLTLWRQISVQQKIDYVRFLGWEWPSMMYAIELVAWHLFFGLSMFFAAFVFKGKRWEKVVRIALIATGLLCIFGLIGPLVGDLIWRLIGVFGYGVGFPIVCVLIARVFKNAPSN